MKQAGPPHFVRLQRHKLGVGVLTALLGMAAVTAAPTAHAVCTPGAPANGTTVTCTGAANPLAPSYASTANDLTVNVQNGASIGVLLGLGGTALQLTGNNVTLNNAGNIDPSLLGLISLLSSGTVVGSATATQVTVNNLAGGRMYGTGALANVSLLDFTGLALRATTSNAGTVSINNAGTIGGRPLVGVSLLGSDIPVVAVNGGGRVNMVNSGTINGRVAFQASAAGNTFVNSGSINGSVSMGASSTNTFTAVTGSTFTGSGAALELLGPGGLLYFAPTGVVDGGRNGNNTLALRNPGNAGTTGSGTLESDRYINFNRLQVGSGSWTLTGTRTFVTGQLDGGVLLTGNAGLFTGQVIGNGGALETTAAGLTFAPVDGFRLDAGGLTVQGANNVTFASTVGGAGALTKAGAGVLALNGANSYAGGTFLNAGNLQLGNNAALGTGALNVQGAARLSTQAALSLTNAIALGAALTVDNAATLALSGPISGAGDLVKTGAGDLLLQANNSFNGNLDIQVGQVITSTPGALGLPPNVIVAGGAGLTLAGGGALGALSGAGTVGVGAGATLQVGANDTSSVFGGQLNGAGNLEKIGNGVFQLVGNGALGGSTTVTAGVFDVAGSLATSALTVANGATLSGAGSITAPVTVADGGRLGLTTGSTLTTGELVLSSGSVIDAGLGAPGAGLLNVNGNLTLDGTLNISDVGGFGSGTYRLIDYTGALTNNGLLYGTLPAGVSLAQLALQTAIGQQINLVVSAPGETVQFWDGAQTIGNGVIEGGAGTWDSGTHWTGADGLINAGWANDFAVFGGLGGGVVTVEGSQATRGLQFAIDGYQLVAGAGGQLELNTAATPVRVDPSATAVLNVPLTGIGALQKIEGGTLVLNGANTYSGGTQLNGGTLIVGNGQALGSGTLTTADGTALDAGTSVALGNAVEVTGALSIGGSNDLTLAGGVGGSGSLVKNGAATLTLGAANTYAGGTRLNAGTLALGNDAALSGGALVVAGASTLADVGAVNIGNAIDLGAALAVSTADDLQLSGVLSGGGGLGKLGGGTLTLSGNNTLGGAFDVQAGRLQLVNEAALGSVAQANVASGATLGLNGGTLDALSGSGTVDLGVGSTLQLGRNDANVGFDGALSGAGGLEKVGGGTLALNGDSAIGGTAEISGGTFVVDGALASAGVNVGSGAALAGAGSVNAPVNIGAGGRLVVRSGQTLTTGSLLMDADATVDALLGVPSDTRVLAVNGDLTLDGTINITDLGGFGDGVYRLIGYTGALSNNGLALGTLPGTVQPGQLVVQTAVGQQVNLVVSASGSTVQFWDGTEVDGDGVIQGGAGTWDDGTHWTDQGGVDNSNWNQGFAVFGGQAGGVVDVVGTQSVTGLQFTRDDYNLVAGANGQLQLNGLPTAVRVDPGVTATLSLPLVGSGSLDKRDTGTLILDGINSYSGGTVLSGGTLVLGNEQALGSGVLTAADGTTLDTAAAMTLANAIALNGAVTLAGSEDLSLSGVVSGNGALVKQGGTTLTLDGTNTYSGGTALQAGTLLLGNAQALGTGTLSATDGTALDTTLATQLGNNIALGGTFTLVGSNDMVLSGNIAGSGALVKDGDTTLTLTGTNSYTGGTTVNAGTLVGTSASLQGGIANESAVVFDQAGDGTFNGSINGSGTLTKQGGGALRLAGANSYSGGTTVAAGTLIGDTASLQGDISNDAALVFDQGSDGSYDGVISGTGSLNKQGAGTLALTGANSYSGGTTVSAGTLQGDTTSLQGDIVDNATLVFEQGDDDTFAGAISGSGRLVKQGGGALRLAGFNSYAGGTTISAGSLVGDTTSLQGNIVDNASLVFDQGDDGTFGGAISGTGAVTKEGDGTLTLAGTNSYSGGTTVDAGTLVGTTSSLQGNIANNAAVVFDQAANGTYVGTLSGAGSLDKTGAGTVLLGGSSAGFSGTTTVSAGALGVGSPATPGAALGGPVVVNNGASLFGNGNIGSLDLSGMLLSGGDAGSLSMLGNAALRSGSTWLISPTSVGTVVPVSIGGTLQIDPGTTLQLDHSDLLPVGSAISIASAGGGVSGTFSQVIDDYAFLTPSVLAAAGGLSVTLERNGTTVPSQGETPNQVSVGGAIETLPVTSPVFNAVILLPDSPAAVTQALSALSGESHANTAVSLLDNRFLAGGVGQRLRGQAFSNEVGANTAWFSARALPRRIDPSGGMPGLRTRDEGVMAGVDRRFGERVVAGVTVGHQDMESWSRHYDDSADIDATHVGLYAQADMGTFSLTGGVDYADYSIESRRQVSIGSTIDERLNADYDGEAISGYVEAAWTFESGSATYTPYLNVTYTRLKTDGFTEQGGVAALSADSQRDNYTSATLGMRAAWDLGQRARLEAGLGWQHAFGDTDVGRTLRLTGGDAFEVRSVSLAENAAVGEFGISVQTSPASRLSMMLQGATGDGEKAYGAQLTWGWSF